MCPSGFVMLQQALLVAVRPALLEAAGEAGAPLRVAALVSVSALLPATSSPFHTSFADADSALLLPETLQQFFAAAPSPSPAASTARKFLSARSDLPAPASSAP